MLDQNTQDMPSASTSAASPVTSEDNNHSDKESGHTPGKNSANTSITKKRVRTGCLCCRRKHKKCDETRPVCKACQSKNEVCEWPTPKLKKSTPRSSTTSITATDQNLQTPANSSQIYSRPIPNSTEIHNLKKQKVEAHTTVPNRRTSFYVPAVNSHLSANPYVPTTTQFSGYQPAPNFTSHLPDVFRTTDVLPFSIHQNQTLNQKFNQTRSSHQRSESESCTYLKLPLNTLLNSEPAVQKEDQSIPKRPSDSSNTESQPSLLSNVTSKTSNFTSPLSEAESKIHFKSMLFKNVSKIRQSQELLNKYMGVTSSPITTSPREFKKLSMILTDVEEIALMKIFICTIGPPLDVLQNRTFKTTIPQLSKNSQALKLAIYTFSSMFTENYKTGFGTSVSYYEKPFELFTNAVQHLVTQPKNTIESVTACLLLTLFNVSLSVASEGRTTYLVPFFNYINTFAPQITPSPALETVKCLSSLLDFNLTSLPEEKPLSNLSIDSPEHFQQIISIALQVAKLISSDTHNFDVEWEGLWNKLFIWNSTKPQDLNPVLEFDKSPFPHILYNSRNAALANQVYHTSMILLVQNKPRLYKIKQGSPRPIPWHAKQTCGIALYNELMICGSQCLWIAGKLLTHEDEHKVIIRLLDDMEVKVGAAMRFNGNDLKNYWDGKSVV